MLILTAGFAGVLLVLLIQLIWHLRTQKRGPSTGIAGIEADRKARRIRENETTTRSKICLRRFSVGSFDRNDRRISSKKKARSKAKAGRRQEESSRSAGFYGPVRNDHEGTDEPNDNVETVQSRRYLYHNRYRTCLFVKRSGRHPNREYHYGKGRLGRTGW